MSGRGAGDDRVRLDRVKHGEIDLDALARCGGVVALVLDELVGMCVRGVTPREIDDRARRLLVVHGAEGALSAAVNARGERFPGVVAVCVNERFTHVPPGDVPLADGDLVTVDLAARVDGWYADASRVVVVGEGSARVRGLADAARRATAACIGGLVVDGLWSAAARRAEAVAAAAGLRILDDFAGHGIGRALHMSPVCWFGGGVETSGQSAGQRALPDQDFVLTPGLVLTIEPVLTWGDGTTIDLSDGWTIATADGAPACFHEQTVAITPSGPRILTEGRFVGRGAGFERL